MLCEFLTFLDLVTVVKAALSNRNILMIFALTGLANFASLEIITEELVVIALSRQKEIVHLGIRSIIVGLLTI